MFTSENVEDNLHKLEKKIDELHIHNEALDKEIAALLSEYKVTEDQISALLSNHENFTKENWETLQKEKKRLDEKLKKELSNIPDPRKRAKSLKDRNIPKDWIFLR